VKAVLVVFDYATPRFRQNYYLILLLLLVFMAAITGLVYLILNGKVTGTMHQGCVAGIVLLSIALISQFGTFKMLHKRLKEEQIVCSPAGIEFKTDDMKIQSNWRDVTGLQKIRKPMAATVYVLYLKGGGTIEFSEHIKEKDVLIKGIENNSKMKFKEGPGVEASAKERATSGESTMEVDGKNALGKMKVKKQKAHNIEWEG
jgi:hypothetical protein